MSDIPPPPPPSSEWPQSPEVKTLRQEFLSLKEGLLGSPLFPQAGAINELRRDIGRADANRKRDVTAIHDRLDAMPDTIARKLNGGIYVRADEFPSVLEAALRKRREKRWGWVAGQGGKVLAGVAIIVIASLFLLLLHANNPALP